MDGAGAAADFAALREAYAAARVAWVELLRRCRHPVRRSSRPSSSRRRRSCAQRLAADEAARAEAERRAAARRAGAGRSRRRVRAVEGLARRRHRRPPGRGARDLGGHAGRCPTAWAAELDHRFAEACRAAEKRHERRLAGAGRSAERLPTLVPEIEALAATANRTPRFAASGTRCASSGRRSPATWRSMPS